LFQTISYADVSAQSATQEVQQLTVIPLNQDVIPKYIFLFEVIPFDIELVGVRLGRRLCRLGHGFVGRIDELVATLEQVIVARPVRIDSNAF
jgi:hypothetical protein